MALIDRLNQEPQPRRTRPCRTAIIVASLPEKDREKLNEIMASLAHNEGKYSASWLASVLVDEGFIEANHSSILRHARGRCCCES